MASDVETGEIGIRFWGVRGSIAVSGPEYAGFGGHTNCLEILGGSNRLLVDAGSGIVPFGADWRAEAGERLDIVLTHLHHDHVIGLLLCAPLFVPGVEVNIYCGHLGGASAEDALRTLFSPPLFPLTFADIPAKVRFIGFRAGEEISTAGFRIRTHALNHPGGATGYRFERQGKALVVLTDHEHSGDPANADKDLAAFCRGAGLIAYDATYDPAEYAAYRGWGHSTWEAGAALALAAEAPVLACIHHAPDHDDRKLAGMERNLTTVLPNGFFARQGSRFTV